MKKSNVWLIALAAIITLSIIACNNGGNTPDSDPPTYTVTFNANGGTPQPQAQTIAQGGKVDEPVITKANHALDGWYAESAFTNKWDFAAHTVTADITLHAKWDSLLCACPEGTTHEGDEKCCEGTDCNCQITEPAVRNFNDRVMFTDSGTDYLADIYDARTQAGSATLEQLGIVGKFQYSVSTAFANGNNPTKNRFRAIFNPILNTRGKVKITIENGVEYASYEIDNRANIRFSFDYLSNVSDADLQAAITAAVTAMNAIPITTVQPDTVRTLDFGTDCKVTIKSDEQFTAAEWDTLCEKVVAAIMRGYEKDMGGVLQNASNQTRFRGRFAATENTSVVLLPNSATWNCEVKDGDYHTIYLKISAIDTVDLQPVVVALSHKYTYQE